jgi:hypothetical protein
MARSDDRGGGGEDILASKEAAGRAKDLAVLEQMREDIGDSG